MIPASASKPLRQPRSSSPTRIARSCVASSRRSRAAHRPVALEDRARRARGSAAHVRDEEPAQLDRDRRDHHHLPVDDLGRARSAAMRDVRELQVAVEVSVGRRDPARARAAPGSADRPAMRSRAAGVASRSKASQPGRSRSPTRRGPGRSRRAERRSADQRDPLGERAPRERLAPRGGRRPRRPWRGAQRARAPLEIIGRGCSTARVASQSNSIDRQVRHQDRRLVAVAAPPPGTPGSGSARQRRARRREPRLAERRGRRSSAGDPVRAGDVRLRTNRSPPRGGAASIAAPDQPSFGNGVFGKPAQAVLGEKRRRTGSACHGGVSTEPGCRPLRPARRPGSARPSPGSSASGRRRAARSTTRSPRRGSRRPGCR